ncbi:MAG TPA: nitrilase-related carbon-nitrogen hydrolase, partial [Cyclobacteriaceae bacterium]|nr:nitrilase-related carbon-nitrogen hydrolase [Cyclobacteriaceae bacterium]
MKRSTRFYHHQKFLLIFAFLVIYSCRFRDENSLGKNTEDVSVKIYSRDSILRIALVQLKPITNPDSILEKGRASCLEAKSQGADIVVFPEMFS